jgi:hypothetical protein
LATVETLSVTAPASDPEELLAFSIDAPRAGAGEDVYALGIEGWVLGRESDAVAVEIRRGDELIQRAPVIRRVREVEAAHPGAPGASRPGFRTLVGVVGLPLTFELELVATLRSGARATIGTVRARHEPVAAGLEPRLQPLRVVCPRRTGSTWLMRLLAAHPRIVAYPDYPYEFTPARYWAHMLKVLAGPANRAHYKFPDDQWTIGPNPYFHESVAREPEYADWYGREYVRRLASFCQQSIDDWYTLVARREGKVDPAYFAEKHIAYPGESTLLVEELYPAAKEVFLVRDFRDMACSLMSFDLQHGRKPPQEPGDEPNEGYFRRTRAMAITVYRNWRERGSGVTS